MRFARLKEAGSLEMDPAVYGPVYKEVYQTMDITTYLRYRVLD